jgi:tetratricopeptide (TPR) repeat protein
VPFVGRATELGRVLAALQGAMAGQGRVVVVSGEMGIGKTRLLLEACHRLQDGRGGGHHPRWVMLGHCHETLADATYAPWAEALTPHVRDLARLELPPLVTDALAPLLPELARTAGGRQLTAPSDRRRVARTSTLQAMVRLLAALPGPALLAIEDVHWTDEASLTLLLQAARSPLVGDLAILVTVRPEDAAPAMIDHLRELQREGRLEWIDLGPLTRSDVAVLVGHLACDANGDLCERVYVETRGNPLFAVEILRSLRDGPDPTALSPEAKGVPTPPTVQAAVRRRLDRLAPAALQLLQTAAIFPGTVPCALLLSVAGQEQASGLRALESLFQARLLVEQDGAGAVPGLPGPLLAFGHVVIRRAVAEQLSAARRKSLHRRAFACLTRSLGDEIPVLSAVEQLALHASEGDLWQEAVTWCSRAAAAAETLCAYGTAGRWLEAALGHLQALPLTRERRRTAIDLRLRLALLGWSTDPARSLAAVASVEQEATGMELGEQEPEVLMRQAEGRLLRGRLGHAEVLLQRLLALARLSRSRRLLAGGLLRLAQLRALRGELKAAVAPFRDGAPLLEELGSHFLYAQCIGTLASTLATLGDFGQARSLLHQLSARAARCGHRSTHVLAALHQLTVEVLQERWAEAAQAGQRLLGLLRQGDHEAYDYIGTVFLGLPLARLGNLAHGLHLQRQAVAMAEGLGLRILLDRAWAYLAELLLEAGDVAGARQAACEGLRIARADGYRFGIAFNTRLRGQVAAAEGRVEVAYGCLITALEEFKAMGALPEIARCHRLLAGVAPDADAEERHRVRARELDRALGLGPRSNPAA